jgi:hypothetical protein
MDVTDQKQESQNLNAQPNPFAARVVIGFGAILIGVGWSLARKRRGWWCAMGLVLSTQAELDCDRVVLSNSLRLYIRQAWHVVEPVTAYLENCDRDAPLPRSGSASGLHPR